MTHLETAWHLISHEPLNIVYIAGPYIGDGSQADIEANIREAETFAAALADHDVGFFCPHTHTQHFGNKSHADEAFYHRLDFAMLTRVADAILFTPRWQASQGAKREHAWSTWRGLPCFYPTSTIDLQDIIAWNQTHAPFDRLSLEAYAEEAADRLFDLGSVPGRGPDDAMVQHQLRRLTAGRRHIDPS